jgi:HEPN domain-containing protein
VEQNSKVQLLINDFATRSFRDIADQDYIAARLSFRHGLYSQFHWQSLQAIEKYLKAILLYNRIKAKNINHDLDQAMQYIRKLPFDLNFSESTESFITHLTYFGRFRYLETSYFLRGPKLLELDKAVWEIRRYCRVLDFEKEQPDESMKSMLESNIEDIKSSVNNPPKTFKIEGGLLEKIIYKTDHQSRSALIWHNAFYGKVTRKTVRVQTPFYAVNSPLTLHPEILDEVLEYIFLPKEIINAYRGANNK